jgi:hypothetical protein
MEEQTYNAVVDGDVVTIRRLAARRLLAAAAAGWLLAAAKEAAAKEAAATQEASEEAGAEDAVDAVERYRAARATPWGAELPKPFLRDLLHCLKGQRGWRGRFRLVCAGWQAAHDEQCTRLQLNIWRRMPAALPCLERVTEVDVPSVSEAVRSKLKPWAGPSAGRRHQYVEEVSAASRLHLHLPKLRSLPSLTHLALDIPVAASAAVATALGSLTTLTTLRVRRNLDLHWAQQSGCDSECEDEESDPESLDFEDIEFDVRRSFYILGGEIKDSGWLASLASLHRLTSLDLSQCHGVTMKALTALQGCTTLDTLALCGRLGHAFYDYEYLRTYPSLVDYDDEDETLLDVIPLLRSLALSTLSLHYVFPSDRELKALALLPGLTALRVVFEVFDREFDLTAPMGITAAGLLAAREAAPHLTITC